MINSNSIVGKNDSTASADTKRSEMYSYDGSHNVNTSSNINSSDNVNTSSNINSSDNVNSSRNINTSNNENSSNNINSSNNRNSSTNINDETSIKEGLTLSGSVQTGSTGDSIAIKELASTMNSEEAKNFPASLRGSTSYSPQTVAMQEQTAASIASQMAAYSTQTEAQNVSTNVSAGGGFLPFLSASVSKGDQTLETQNLYQQELADIIKDSNSTNVGQNVQNYLNEKLGDDNNLKFFDEGQSQDKILENVGKSDKVSVNFEDLTESFKNK